MEDQLRKLVADRIRDRGLSVKAAAKEAGVDHTIIYAFLRGSTSVRTDTASKLCAWLGVALAPIGESHAQSLGDDRWQEIRRLVRGFVGRRREDAEALEALSRLTDVA